jgi:hypothetical protein
MTPDEANGRTEEEFGRRMHEVLSPSQTIQHPALLRGRQSQLDEIRRAFFSQGRQVFIYGHRGVGKSSLAQTAAFQQQSSDRVPILVQCTPLSSCFDVVREIVSEALPGDPRTIKQTFEASAKAGIQGFGFGIREQIEQGAVPRPTTLNECARILELVCKWHSNRPLVVIDEFDQVVDPAEQLQFANMVKTVADRHIPVAIIFCGIGASLDDLFTAHQSAHRYFHTVPLERLPWTPRLEIIDNPANTLGISVDDTTRYRIANVSDGFPHYVHLICEKLFWRVFAADSGSRVTPDLFEQSVEDAVASMEPELRKPYELATKKYTNDCESILWAVADSEHFQRPSREVFQSYERIMSDLERAPLDRQTFNARMRVGIFPSVYIFSKQGVGAVGPHSQGTTPKSMCTAISRWCASNEPTTG